MGVGGNTPLSPQEPGPDLLLSWQYPKGRLGVHHFHNCQQQVRDTSDNCCCGSLAAVLFATLSEMGMGANDWIGCVASWLQKKQEECNVSA